MGDRGLVGGVFDAVVQIAVAGGLDDPDLPGQAVNAAASQNQRGTSTA